jgi:hypothetical protein
MDLDPDKLVNSMSDAAIQAEILKKFQAENPEAAPPEGGPPQGQPPQGGAVAGAEASDPTGAGGGTIGTGMAPQPGEQGFSANGQGTPVQ